MLFYKKYFNLFSVFNENFCNFFVCHNWHVGHGHGRRRTVCEDLLSRCQGYERCQSLQSRSNLSLSRADLWISGKLYVIRYINAIR